MGSHIQTILVGTSEFRKWSLMQINVLVMEIMLGHIQDGLVRTVQFRKWSLMHINVLAMEII